MYEHKFKRFIVFTLHFRKLHSVVVQLSLLYEIFIYTFLYRKIRCQK